MGPGGAWRMHAPLSSQNCAAAASPFLYSLPSHTLPHTQVRAPTGFLLRIEPELSVPAGGDAGTLAAEIPSLGLKAEAVLDYAQAGRGLGSLEILVPADAVELWWPLGYGEQVCVAFVCRMFCWDAGVALVYHLPTSWV